MSTAARCLAYDALSYSREELGSVMRETYDELIDFVTTLEFKHIMTELTELSAAKRPAFVLDVLLNQEELVARGITVPSGILIQRSAFGDRRPTLFVVKKFLPEEFSDVWQNVNITIDNEFLDAAVSRDPETCWRPPLDVDLQSQAMASDVDLETL